MKLLSWNVNGVRAALRYGLLDYLSHERADIVCLQETRCHIDAMAPLAGGSYHVFLNPAQRAGYSGTAILSRVVPRAVFYGIGLLEHDDEGRVLTAEYADFYLVNVYVPNAKRRPRAAALPAGVGRGVPRVRADALEERKPVVFCGDLNVAHTPLDLARPKQNVGNKGLHRPRNVPGSRRMCRRAFCDTFRVVRTGTRGITTWWSNGWPVRARATSAGASTTSSCPGRCVHGCASAFIRPEVTGSDHCPVGIELDEATSAGDASARP